MRKDTFVSMIDTRVVSVAYESGPNVHIKTLKVCLVLPVQPVNADRTAE